MFARPAYNTWFSRLVSVRPRVSPLTAGFAFATLGLSVACTANPDWRQRFIAHNKSAAPLDAPSSLDPTGSKFDKDTLVEFPRYIESLTLLGIGVRTVSFLRVKVYSAGFYADANDMKASFAATASGEEMMKRLVENAATAIRIVPVRNTDMAHLRDGLVRAVQARLKAARNSKSLPAGEDERVGKALQAFKALFPARSIAKGSSLTLHRNRAGVLRVEHDGVDLGHVDDPWLSRELFIAYFADKDVISVKLKEDVERSVRAIH